MPGFGKRGKPTGRLPTLSTSPWESRQTRARFPHSHSSDDEGGWKSGKPRAGFPLSHRPGSYTRKPNNTGPSARLVPATATNSVTFSAEATRPGKVVDAGQASIA